MSQSVIIAELLPNPVGSDAAGEYILLQGEADLSGWQLTVGPRVYTFPAGTTLTASAELRLPQSTTGLQLANTGREVVLTDTAGTVIHSVQYGKADDGVLFVWNGKTLVKESAPESARPETRKSEPEVLQTGTLSDSVRISEILPDPAGQTDAEEYIELQNYSTETVDLAGWTLADAGGKSYTLPQTLLEPGAYTVLRRSETRLALNNSGRESVTLRDFTGAELSTVEYEVTTTSVALAYDGQEYRATPHLTPGAANRFSTRKVTGEVSAVEDTEVTVQTTQGSEVLALPYGLPGSDLLALTVQPGLSLTALASLESGAVESFTYSAPPQLALPHPLPLTTPSVLAVCMLWASLAFFGLGIFVKILFVTQTKTK